MPPIKNKTEVLPIAIKKLDNLTEALIGRVPINEKERQLSYKILQDSFRFSLDDALDEYINYQNSGSIKKFLVNIGLKTIFKNKASNYIKEQALPTTNFRLERLNRFYAPEEQSFAKDYLTGLSNALANESIATQGLKNVLDYRKLEDPIPFVTSKIKFFGQ